MPQSGIAKRFDRYFCAMTTRPRPAVPWWALAAVTALLVLPLVAWVVQWGLDGWIPQGDQAVAALKTRDVFSTHPPVQGMRSTSSFNVPDAHAHHLGPAQFYAMAVPYAVTLWHPVGLLLGGALIASVFIAITVVQGWRVARWRGVAVAALTVVGVEFFVGPVIVLPWNPYPPLLGLAAVLVTGWRLTRGGTKALPWFVGCASFVAQANLAYLPVLAPLLLGLAGLGLVRWYEWRGAVWPLPGEGGPEERGARTTLRHRPGWVAVIVLLVCWLPSIVELFTYSPNNATEVGRLFAGMASSRTVVFAVAGIVAVGIATYLIVRLDRPSLVVTARYVAGLGLAGLAAALVAGGNGRAAYAWMGLAAVPFAVAVLLFPVIEPAARAIARVAKGRNGVTAMVGAAVCAIAVAMGPGALVRTPWISMERTNVADARRSVDDATKAVTKKADEKPAVEVLGADLPGALSYAPAVMVKLRSMGYDVYTPRIWPNDEDDAFRDALRAPQHRLQVIVRAHQSPVVGYSDAPR